MFCPKCGQSEQTPFSYCRACGEWLVDQDKPFSFANMTGEEYIVVVIIFNILSIIAAVFIGYALLNGFGEQLNPVYLAALAFGLAVWQVTNSIFTLKIRSHLKRRTFTIAPMRKQELKNAVDKSLSAADTSQFIKSETSVIERTTDLLEAVPLRPKKQLSGDLI